MTTLPSISNYTPIMPKQNINIKNQQLEYTPKQVAPIEKIERSIPKEELPGRMLLALMRSALSGEKTDSKIFSGCTETDWIKMYNLSHNNAVTQLAFDGLKKNSDIKAPKECIENMKINQDFVKEYHSMQEKVLGDFVKLTNAAGYDTIQMKGIGFSMNYPDPQKRFGGDIDIVNIKRGTIPEKSMKKSSFEVDKLAKKAGSEVDTEHGVKHSIVRYKGMPIENHRTFLNIKNNIPMFKKMNDYLLKHIDPVEQILPNGTKIKVPSKEFNTVFISFHAMQHFASGNVNFHHLADWAVHVQKHGLKVPEEAKGTMFEKFMYAFTNLANKHLGTNVKVPENKKLEDEILSQMLNPGKPTAQMIPPKTKNPIRVIAFKLKRMQASVNKQNAILGEGASSMKKMLMMCLKYNVKHPKNILKMFTHIEIR
ncbi:MAG: nucleotidyltransferase family protein [Candidatus Gastranaerophilaceae bacterium]